MVIKPREGQAIIDQALRKGRKVTIDGKPYGHSPHSEVSQKKRWRPYNITWKGIWRDLKGIARWIYLIGMWLFYSVIIAVVIVWATKR